MGITGYQNAELNTSSLVHLKQSVISNNGGIAIVISETHNKRNYFLMNTYDLNQKIPNMK